MAMVDETLEKIRQTKQIITTLNHVICNFYVDEKVHSVCIDIKENEQIDVCFEKDYVVVRTQTEVKFVCKGKAFISLWG